MNRFFYGWYMKCQSPAQTLAVIPAVHQVNHHQSCSIQIVTDRNAWNVEFPGDIYGRSGHALQAPMNGDMVRTIHESTACRAFYRFCKEGHTLFEIETQMASFEYEFPE